MKLYCRINDFKVLELLPERRRIADLYIDLGYGAPPTSLSLEQADAKESPARTPLLDDDAADVGGHEPPQPPRPPN